MILAGLMFDYDKLNGLISSKEKVPLVADLMASRWAYEAMAVDMFSNNAYQSPYYDLEKEASKANYATTYVVPQLKKELDILEDYINNIVNEDDEIDNSMDLINSIVHSQSFKGELEHVDLDSLLSKTNINNQSVSLLKEYVESLEHHNYEKYNLMMQRKDKLMNFLELGDDYTLNDYKLKYHNQSLEDLVRKTNTENRVEVHDNKLIQHIDPIYNESFIANGPLNYRTQFYAPVKPFFNRKFNTYWFNIIVIWVMTIGLYIALYNEWLFKIISLSNRVGSK